MKGEGEEVEEGEWFLTRGLTTTRRDVDCKTFKQLCMYTYARPPSAATDRRPEAA